MFDLNADWAAIVGSLRADPLLAATVQKIPGLRIPGCWDGFELAIRAVLGQRINASGAASVAGKVVKAFGHSSPPVFGITHFFPTPETLAEANLAGMGLSKTQAEGVRALSRAVCDGKISFTGTVNSQALLNGPCHIPGIDVWTAQYIAMRALGETDAFPLGDLALVRSLGLTSNSALESRAESWRPWRAYGAMYLWSIIDDRAASKARAARAEKTTITGHNVPRSISAAG
jgi:AraC family transcriptional regulator of adaptative response / DNA-3-methyladenine glycosylase II